MAKKTKKNYTSTEVGTILEEVRSDFKVFGESLGNVERRGNATFEAVGKLQEGVTILKEDVKTLKNDMVFVKGELGIIRNELKEKVGRDEFVLLEKRVAFLEKNARR